MARVTCLLVLVLALPATKAQLACRAENCFAGYTPSDVPCQLAEPHEALAAFKSLATALGGQEQALEIVEGKLLLKLATATRPTAMHFAGDNGVGKTMLAKLLSRAMFRNPHALIDGAGDGLLFIETSQYRGLEAGNTQALRAASNSLINKVSTHLSRCPDALLLLDEMEKMDPLLSDPITRILKGEVLQGVPSQRATVILTSDFGSEGALRGKTFEQIRAIIHTQTLHFFKGEKAIAKLVDIVPFVTPEKPQFRLMIDAMFRTLPCQLHQVRCLQFDAAAIDTVTQQAVEANENAIRNGRGAFDLFSSRIVAPLAKFSLRNGGDSFAVTGKQLRIARVAPIAKEGPARNEL
eukprot:TRINITY_DN71217_c0_g1_i1.p1 TRINITY_DN71217_c0_g1~~TRINITY_DN71217_c0_g1_i1.p1  ORF type:complete len:359 (-),score=61.30 TRINITY_DN71217_c0_g1_i1:70-1125(-)